MTPKATVSIFQHFEDLTDPRRDKNQEHKLMDMIVIAVCAVICGCEHHTQIALYGEKKKDWLETFLDLPNGIPSHDTFSRLFRRLNPEQFAACFRSWAASLVEATDGRVIPIDGKALRHSFDGDGNPLHLVSAWAADNHVSLGQMAVDDKSNEITAIPKLLELIDVAGGLVTIDAMGCQKEIAAKIREQKADYVLAVKDNQPYLLEDISAAFAEQLEQDFLEIPHDHHETYDKGHGREEWRSYYVMDVPEMLRNREAWKDLQTIGMAISYRHVEGQIQSDVRYYIGSIGRDAKRFAEAVRSHWGIENSLHWVLDVSFDEDQSRIRKDHGPENFALLRRLAVGLLKQDKKSKASIQAKRLAAGWDDEYLMQILTGAGTDV